MIKLINLFATMCSLIVNPKLMCSNSTDPLDDIILKKTINNNFDLGEPIFLHKEAQNVKLLNYENRFKKEYEYEYPMFDISYYKFPKYIDLDIRDSYVRRVKPHESISFMSEYREEKRESYSESYKEVQEYYNEVKTSIGTKVGDTYNFKGYNYSIESKYSLKASTIVTIGESFKNEISSKFTNERIYGTIHKEEHNFINDNDFDVWYRLCYREKFEIYKISINQYSFEVHANDRGMGGVDYSYSRNKLINSSDYFLLLPSSDPIYLDECSYSPDNSGHMQNLEAREENNIIYL